MECEKCNKVEDFKPGFTFPPPSLSQLNQLDAKTLHSVTDIVISNHVL